MAWRRTPRSSRPDALGAKQAGGRHGHGRYRVGPRFVGAGNAHDAGPGALLRRPGAEQERAGHDHAQLHHAGPGQHPVRAHRLLDRLRSGPGGAGRQPGLGVSPQRLRHGAERRDRKSTRLNSNHAYISYSLFFFNDTATTEISPLSLHAALPISFGPDQGGLVGNLDWAFLRNVSATEPNAAYAATIPHQTYMIFQPMFAVITPALITGAFAERAK